MFNGVLFMIFAYISKMENFLRDSFIVENDDNPWNNKDTEDFMRHLKAEMFAIVYPAAFIEFEATIGFPSEGPSSFASYGPHETPCKVFYAICLVPRAFNLLSLLFFGWYNINWSSTRFKT